MDEESMIRVDFTFHGPLIRRDKRVVLGAMCLTTASE